jgi:hypothetical protein
MDDSCVVVLLAAAERDLGRLARRNPDRFASIQAVIETVVERGWRVSLQNEVIKILDADGQIGEIRDVGRPGHRLFFFWMDADIRILYVARVEKKADVTGRARFSACIDATRNARRRFLYTETDEWRREWNDQ